LNLSDIEPIAGAGFAMCLAYLALDRFRYRNEVESSAQSALATLDKEGDGQPDPPQSIANNDAMLELKWLARLNCNGFSPQHPWAWVYATIFRREIDVYATIILAAIAAFCLAAGVAEEIKIWDELSYLSTMPILGIAFYVCLISIIIPPVMVYFGRFIMHWSARRTRHLEGQLVELLRDRVSRVLPPPIPELPSDFSD
jgi:hypothetical protein